MYEVSVTLEFSAAHRLAGYEGNCERLHGHNWTVEAGLQGTELDHRGLLCDFREVKRVLRGVLETLDHRELNDVDALAGINPSSENLARFIYDQMNARLRNERFSMAWVTVWETALTRATYRGNRQGAA